MASEPAIITLTTDFGTRDSYVAEMKGVILAINRRARMIDITHEVRPQCVAQAAFLTQAAWSSFPPDAVHLVVVDPGVGTARRALALETPRGRFVGPDNGVLSAALPDDRRPRTEGPVELPPRHRAIAITNRSYLREPVSATFHGRDVFAPAAAHLSLGVALDELGEPVARIAALPPFRAQPDASGVIQAAVVHIDRFGNAVTDVRRDDLPEGPLDIEIAGRRVSGLVRTYAEAEGLAALVGSSGYLEIALREGNAAQALGIDIGAHVVIRSA